MGSLCANALMEKDGKESSQSKKQSAKRDKERLRRENIKKEAPLSDIIRANPHYTRFYELLRSFSTSRGWIHPPHTHEAKSAEQAGEGKTRVGMTFRNPPAGLTALAEPRRE